MAVLSVVFLLNIPYKLSISHPILQIVFGAPLRQGDVEHDRVVVRQIVDVTRGRIDKNDLTIGGDPVALVHVPKHVVLGFDPLLHCGQQFHTSSSHPRTAQISVTNGRSVRDQNVQVFRNFFPLVQTVLATFHVEGPLAELRLPRGTVDFQPVQFDRFILQVHAVAQVLSYVLRLDRFGQAFFAISQGRDFVQQSATGFLATGTRILERVGECVVEAELVVPCYDQFMLVR